MHARGAPQSGQVRCSGGTSWTTRRRGRLADSGLRPWPLGFGRVGAGVGSGSGRDAGACDPA
jgi:hypothetical protein